MGACEGTRAVVTVQAPCGGTEIGTWEWLRLHAMSEGCSQNVGVEMIDPLDFMPTWLGWVIGVPLVIVLLVVLWVVTR